jgi:archaellum component FlaF (FlaF/FlaG flagellin family)
MNLIFLRKLKTVDVLFLRLQNNGSSVCVMQCTRVIRDGTLIEKNVWRFLSIVFDLERTNQLNLLPDKDLVDLCHPIEP